jgi:hypothetical protein
VRKSPLGHIDKSLTRAFSRADLSSRTKPQVSAVGGSSSSRTHALTTPSLCARPGGPAPAGRDRSHRAQPFKPIALPTCDAGPDSRPRSSDGSAECGIRAAAPPGGRSSRHRSHGQPSDLLAADGEPEDERDRPAGEVTGDIGDGSVALVGRLDALHGVAHRQDAGPPRPDRGDALVKPALVLGHGIVGETGRGRCRGWAWRPGRSSGRRACAAPLVGSDGAVPSATTRRGATSVARPLL